MSITTSIGTPGRALKGSVSMLEISELSLAFGGIRALSSVDLSLRAGDISSIIGPNGAGKTTLLNTISGFYVPQQGSIRFDGIELVGRRPSFRSASGIARTFQNICLYRGLSVLENIKLGAHGRLRTNVWAALMGTSGVRRAEEELTQTIRSEIAPLMGIEAYLDAPVGALSYGVQKRVELARALALSPRLLMLDEPVAGMNTTEKQDTAELIRSIRDTWGTTIVMIEHDMSLVMGISDHVCVLSFGQKVCDGRPEDVQCHPGAIAAYLGSAEVASEVERA